MLTIHLAILPKAQKNRRDVWSIDTFKKALSLAEDDLLLLCLHLAFSCSLRIGEINGLDWNNVIIDDESIKTGNARVIINRELTRVSLEAMQKLKERDIIYIFPTQKPHATTRLVLKTPKTESSNRVVWLPTSVALLLKQHYSDQKELKEFLGDAYNDYNLVIALDNGNPVESRIVRKRFDALCAKNDLKPVVFHSLRHLSTGYKLKLTNGDIKSVQGDTGHAESDMVLDIYSRVLDEDRRQNAQKMDQKFYNTLSDVEVESSNTDYNDENFLKDLMGFLSIDSNRAQLQNMMNQANKK